jgi:hypothetical protein
VFEYDDALSCLFLTLTDLAYAWRNDGTTMSRLRIHVMTQETDSTS